MNWMQSQYKSWETFRVAGTRFLALHAQDNNVHVYNELMENYGSYWSVAQFKKMYRERGAELNLGK